MPLFSAVEWGPKRKEAFVEYIRHEVLQTEGDREELERTWENRLLAWRAKMPEGTLDYPYPGAPLSRDTEILTRLGWKRVDEVEIGELVLTRKDEDSSLSWEPVRATPSVWAPQLYHLKSDTVDLMMTPGHTCVLRNQRGDIVRKTAEDIWGKTGYRIPLTGSWQGTDTDKLFGLDAGDVSEFVGWYISEGSGAGKGTIQIAQKKLGMRDVIETLLSRLGFSYSKHANGFSVHVSTIPKELVWWLDMGVCDEKYIPGFFYGASPRLLKRLFYGLLGGDGTINYRTGANLPVLNYYTTSPRLADDVMALAQLMGKRAALRVRSHAGSLVPAGGVIDGRQIQAKRVSYEVAILHSPNAKINPEHYRGLVEYNDLAFCVTVANHAIYVRRNGKACWTGNSNLELPLIDMHHTPMLADMLQSFHAAEDYWTPQARRPDRVDQASALREGMTAIERRFLKMRRVNKHAFLENGLLGTAFYKNSWRSESKRQRRYRADGESESLVTLVSEPKIEWVPIQRVRFPAYAWSLDFDAPGGTPWIAQEHRWSVEEYERFRIGSGELVGFDREAAEKARSFFVDEEEPIRSEMEREDEFEPFTRYANQVFEVWCRFDTRGDNTYEDILVTVHLSAGVVLRAIYFPNAHGKHPFSAINYLPGYGIYGIGLAEIDEWAQEASTQLLNAHIDNVRLANTRMFSAPEGARFSQDEQVYPSKVWYLGPDESIGEVRLSDVYASGFQTLQQLMSLAELRSGVNDLRQGSLTGLPSRTPATSLLSILREGNKRFDMIHTGVRDVHGEMGLRMLQNVSQRAKEDPMRWGAFFQQAIGPEDAARVMQVLLTPEVEFIEEAFGIHVSATSASVNKEVEKQSFVGMLQLAQQIYGALIQTMLLHAQVPDPVVQAVAKASFVSGVDLLKQLLQRFDVQNAEEHLGNLEAIANAFNAQAQPGGNAATGGMFALQQNGLGILGGAGGIPPQGLDLQALLGIR